MFGAFDEMFDFNRDGELDAGERAAEYQFMEEMLESDHDDDSDDYDSDDSDY